MLFKNSENKKALIIFIKNPQLGKVKTRLAATVGNEKALEIYRFLLDFTRQTTENLDVDKYVFYSDFIDNGDEWNNEKFFKKTQHPDSDLGIKMAHAFREMVASNHEKVLIIGSDCLELSQEFLEESFNQLSENEAIIGKASDGGYYMIGFNFEDIGEQYDEVLDEVFLNKQWSHANVAHEALESFKKLNLKFAQMPVLNDIDEKKDLLKYNIL